MRRLGWLPWRWLLVLLSAGVVVALTTTPRRVGVMRFIETTVGGSQALETIGHGALFALLTLVSYVALRRRLRFRLAFAAALLLGLLLGTITELSQQFTPGRTASLSDLLANWLGAFVVATAISFMRR
jgi:glycopeptide antibiotics resistance protein